MNLPRVAERRATRAQPPGCFPAPARPVARRGLGLGLVVLLAVLAAGFATRTPRPPPAASSGIRSLARGELRYHPAARPLWANTGVIERSTPSSSSFPTLLAPCPTGCRTVLGQGTLALPASAFRAVLPSRLHRTPYYGQPPPQRPS